MRKISLEDKEVKSFTVYDTSGSIRIQITNIITMKDCQKLEKNGLMEEMILLSQKNRSKVS